MVMMHVFSESKKKESSVSVAVSEYRTVELAR
jgi:hypothetical protein